MSGPGLVTSCGYLTLVLRSPNTRHFHTCDDKGQFTKTKHNKHKQKKNKKTTTTVVQDVTLSTHLLITQQNDQTGR